MKNNIEYIETDQRDLDAIGFLWEKLKEHHRARSPHFAGFFLRWTWEERKRELLGKCSGGLLRLDIARDVATGKIVGYCASTINPAGQGEIESIYIEIDYRRQGIGGAFMKKALAWMDSLAAKTRVIGVAAGNEEAFPFYARYGFYPRVTYLRRVDSQL
jgi:ribosomal protein S18 acetylase RimI-like enzyme